MNLRDRFLNTFQFKGVDRVPDCEFGYWTETIDRWNMEVLPLEKEETFMDWQRKDMNHNKASKPCYKISGVLRY